MGRYGSLVCELIPEHPPAGCAGCGKPLPKRRTRWCSDWCSSNWWRTFAEQHDWAEARAAALKRDRGCVRCGAMPFDEPEPHLRDFTRERWKDYLPAHKAWVQRRALAQLEVNHIVPRVGKGYGRGCHNHLDNLETLCHRCHVKVTNVQRAARKESSSCTIPTRATILAP
jgi:5-methylcytosine-specific restriction endonuclease McrA